MSRTKRRLSRLFDGVECQDIGEVEVCNFHINGEQGEHTASSVEFREDGANVRLHIPCGNTESDRDGIELLAEESGIDASCQGREWYEVADWGNPLGHIECEGDPGLQWPEEDVLDALREVERKRQDLLTRQM